MVVGCHVGECDFEKGNIMAEKHVNFVKRILERRGLGRDRVNMYYCSAAEVNRFKESIDDMMKKLEKLGPNPIREEKIITVTHE
jgi:F420-non-reducing hydrogenase iron-sulfur subunit